MTAAIPQGEASRQYEPLGENYDDKKKGACAVRAAELLRVQGRVDSVVALGCVGGGFIEFPSQVETVMGPP